ILGNTIMRVATKYKNDGIPTSCENDFDGEVEDYTINVEAELSIQEFGFANFNVFPNPNQGEFNIKLNSASTSKINVEVYDVSGRMIYQNLYEKGGDFNETILLKNAQSGIYLLRVSDGLRRATKKIVVDR